MDTLLLSLIPIALALLGIVVMLFMLDWLKQNYRKPIFIIIIIVTIIHLLLLYYIPIKWTSQEHTSVHIELMPSKSTWEQMLLDQQAGLIDDTVFVVCEETTTKEDVVTP